MPVIQSYPNGLTMGTGNPSPTGGPRSVISGWSPSAVRRHTRWLYSVQVPALHGSGYSLTLTVRDLPPSAEDWKKAREAWLAMVRKVPGFIRLHWLTEWQRRGVPHMHCAVYFNEDIPKEVLTILWVQVCANRGWAVKYDAQDVKEIDGPLGWLQYLSKHASRGVKHYQRMGKPESWEKTGRLWGKIGDWPVQEQPIRAELTKDEGFRFRRLVRSYLIAQARSENDWKRVSYLRRILKNNDRVISQVRGVSQWIPERVFLLLVNSV